MRLSFTPTHAVLALLIGTAAVLLAGVAVFTEVEQGRERTLEGAEIAAAASGLAAALEPASDERAVLDEVVRRENLVGALVLDPVGRVEAQSAGRRLDGIDWNAALGPASDSGAGNRLVRRTWQGELYWMATSSTVDGRRVVLLRSVTPDGSPLFWVLGAAALLWLLVAGVAVAVLRMGRRPAELLQNLARDLARSESVSAIELVQKKIEVRTLLGDRSKPLFDLASDLVSARERAEDARTLANAFLQVGPHYVLLCTLDGKILDANPAFFARTNLMAEWLRGQPIAVLEETLPMEPLMKLARRSKKENAAISGVPYALNVEGGRRAVDVALRTIQTTEGDTVLLILSDLTKERTLENQIDQYSDALELMVDQRVAELTAGHDELDPLLEAAGVVAVTFDRDGETKRFNAGAERLTGRTAFTIRRFEHLARALFTNEADLEAFAAWFTGAGHRTLELPVQSPQGLRSILWMRAERRQAGEVVQCALFGIEQAASPPAFVEMEHVPEAHVAEPAGSFRNTPLVAPPNAAGLAPPHADPGGDGYAYRHERTS